MALTAPTAVSDPAALRQTPAVTMELLMQRVSEQLDDLVNLMRARYEEPGPHP